MKKNLLFILLGLIFNQFVFAQSTEIRLGIQALTKQNEALELKVKNLESRFKNLEVVLNQSNAGK